MLDFGARHHTSTGQHHSRSLTRTNGLLSASPIVSPSPETGSSDPYSSLGHQIWSAESALGVVDLRNSGVDRACHGEVDVGTAQFQHSPDGGAVGYNNAQLQPPLARQGLELNLQPLEYLLQREAAEIGLEPAGIEP